MDKGYALKLPSGALHLDFVGYQQESLKVRFTKIMEKLHGKVYFWVDLKEEGFDVVKIEVEEVNL